MATTDKPRSHDIQPDEVEYRALSTTALVGLALSLASLLAFIHPLLWGLPAAAIVVNLLALRQISERVPTPIGRRAAEIGLALAVILLVACPTRSYVVAERSRAEAKRLALMWFEAVRTHQLAHAVDLMQNMTLEKLTGTEEVGEVDPEAPRAAQPRGPLPVVEVVHKIRAMGSTYSLRYLGAEKTELTTSREKIATFWEVSGEIDGVPETFLLRISLDRERKKPRQVRSWQISGIYPVMRLPAELIK